jgi:uncharacterized protein
MNFEANINNDLKEAMKAKNEVALRTIRAIKSAILLFKTDGSGQELDDAAALKIVQKMVKQRRESLSIYEQQGRNDLAQTEREELAVLENYMPKQLSEEALDVLVRAAIAEIGASSLKDMGKVIGIVSKKAAGQAEGAVISAAVKRILA